MIKKIATSKVFIQRSLLYISIINFCMVLFVTISNLEKYIEMNIIIIYPIAILIGMTLLVLVGYIEDKIGLFKQELEVMHYRSPQLMETLQTVRRIEQQLKK